MKILAIEQQLEMAKTLAFHLPREGYTVEVATINTQHWEQSHFLDVNIVVIDLDAVGLDGLELCCRIKIERPEVLVLMVTARHYLVQGTASLNLGADDYLVKPYSSRELCARVIAFIHRLLRDNKPMLQYKDLRLDPEAKLAWRGQQRLMLTNKEYGILEYLLRNQGRIVTEEELMEHVWGVKETPTTQKVASRILALRRKLGDRPRMASCYIEITPRAGYKLGLSPVAYKTSPSVEAFSQSI